MGLVKLRMLNAQTPCHRVSQSGPCFPLKGECSSLVEEGTDTVLATQPELPTSLPLPFLLATGSILRNSALKKLQELVNICKRTASSTCWIRGARHTTLLEIEFNEMRALPCNKEFDNLAKSTENDSKMLLR